MAWHASHLYHTMLLWDTIALWNRTDRDNHHGKTSKAALYEMLLKL
jgi:hypothetical protein